MLFVPVPNDEQNIPFMPIVEGIGFKRSSIFVRSMASSEEADYEQLQTLINRKIATGRSTQPVIDLAKHLADLKALYSHVDRFKPMQTDLLVSLYGKSPNPNYPTESLDAFIKRAIEIKKRPILTMLDEQSAQ